MGLEKTGISQMSQCLKDCQPQSTSVSSTSDIIFLEAFPQQNGPSLPNTRGKYEIFLSWEELLRRTASPKRAAKGICSA